MTGPATREHMHRAWRHDSAAKHVTGLAAYADDIVEPTGMLHAYLGLSTAAHAGIAEIDLSAVCAAPGVVGVLTAADIPGENDISPTGAGDDPVFADKVVSFFGQPIFAVVARTRAQARKAARFARVVHEKRPAVIDADEAVDAVSEPLTLARGDVEPALRAAPRRLQGTMRTGGQDHFYLEGHIALAMPGEDSEVRVVSSTQHPSEVQHMVAHVLGVPSSAVTVTVRRMGGGFGGKETQSNLFAAVAALAARKFGQAVKLRPDRDDDMTATGKRHEFRVDYDVGFDDDGRILAVDAVLTARCGFSADLSGAVADRALFHADNAYFFPAVRLRSRPMRTNTVSNTAFRGFGAPQGVITAERIIEEVAYSTGRPSLDVRKVNLYGGAGRNLTPYHQPVEDNIVPRLVGEIEERADYASRRRAVLDFNARGGILRRGIALTPVKFGVSFTATWMNQAGALVHVYRDGSIHLNHGGTEMGQGLFIKVASVVADCFQVGLDRVQITATSTGKVPNTSPTAASTGSDLNGMAAFEGAETIRRRLVAFAAEHWNVEPGQVAFEAGRVRIGNQDIAFAELVEAAYMARVQLSATGFYRTPEIHWDRAAGRGQPFYYFAYSAGVTEVEVDTLTGEYRVLRVDILHDAGRSLNPAIDLGQVEGGFIQGMGWVTTEELWWDGEGRLRTHAPSTYKIPLASDCPPTFNVHLADWSENAKPTIGRSKAIGEPPLLLCASVVEALSMAVASTAGYRRCPKLDTPATPERLLLAIERLKREGTR